MESSTNWLKDFLVPELKAGRVVIMDNASFHKSQKTRELIEEAGCRLLFLPPYSPDLNPIEIFWANPKKKVRVFLERVEGIKLADAIDYIFSGRSNEQRKL